MKIEIILDIEKIVSEEIREYIRSNIVISNAVISGIKNSYAAQVANAPPAVQQNLPVLSTYEYGPTVGRRRTKVEIAAHNQELALGRVLTTAEKETLGIAVVPHLAVATTVQLEQAAMQKQLGQLDDIEPPVEDAVEPLTSKDAHESAISDSTVSENLTIHNIFTAVEEDVVLKVDGEDGMQTIPTAPELKNLDSLFK